MKLSNKFFNLHSQQMINNLSNKSTVRHVLVASKRTFGQISEIQQWFSSKFQSFVQSDHISVSKSNPKKGKKNNLVTWTEYLTARLATVSPRTIRWEMANFPIPFSLQKDPFAGFPTTSFSFQGALNAKTIILLSEATEFQTLLTQLARARSVTESFDKIKRSVSGQVRAVKWEFMGEITVDGSAEIEELEERSWSWRGSSSFWSPQHPIFRWTLSRLFCACASFF